MTKGAAEIDGIHPAVLDQFSTRRAQITLRRRAVAYSWSGDDDNGVELEFRPDGTIGILIDVGGHTTEYSVTTFTDAAVHEAASWARKLA